jgi:hypothetical protein
MKKALALLVVAIILCQVFAVLTPTARAETPTGSVPEVVCVPFHGKWLGVPHDAWIGKEIVLKGTAHDPDGDGTLVSYNWDFGDGYTTGWIAGVNPYAIEAKHTYSGTMADGTTYGPGKFFTAWLSVKDGEGNVGQDSYFVAIRDVSDPKKKLEFEVNVAIDNGLWWLHKSQYRYSSGGIDYGYWQDSSYPGYLVASTSTAVLVFEIHGHMPIGDKGEDPYVETVKRGLNYVFTRCYSRTISGPSSSCPYGNPDTNGNGIGIDINSGLPVYEIGMVMMAIAASGDPNTIAATGGANVAGRTYFDILTDMVDMCAWGQNEAGSGRGGWRYGWNYGNSDNSVTQWPIIGLEAAETNWGISAPDFVKSELDRWLAYSQNANGGFGYTSPTEWVNVAKTGAGLCGLAYIGLPSTDARAVKAVNYLNLQWGTSGTDGYWGNYYSLYAVMKGCKLFDPAIEYIGSHNWYYDDPSGFARYLVNQQMSDGRWPTGSYGGYVLDTGWAILTLTPTITFGPPVANAGPDVDNHPPEPVSVKFDASGSYHTDPTKKIVLYEWDFESDGTWDYSGTAIKVEHSYPAYKKDDGSIDWDKTAKDYTATLRVTDNSDPPKQDTDTCIVHITPPPWKPVADPDGPYEAYEGVSLQLDGSKSYDPESKMYTEGHPWYETITTYEWDLDNDGQFDDSTEMNPSYTWTTKGTYSVGLKVTDSQPSGPGGTVGPLDVDVKYTTVVVKSGEIVNLGIVPVNTADESIAHKAVPKPTAKWVTAHSTRYTVADRENDFDIRWIVIHVLSPETPGIPDGGYAGTINYWSTTPDGASTHYVVKIDGSEITQMVLDKDIAYHAGNWEYNKHSIGIEIAGYAGTTIWLDSLYQKVGWLTRFLAEDYGIALNHPAGIAPADPTTSTGIIGHDQVPDPNDPSKGGGIGHHTDPGSTWDWSKFMNYVNDPHAPSYFSEIGEKITDYYLEVSYGTLYVNVDVYHNTDGDWFSVPQTTAWYSTRNKDVFMQHAIDSCDGNIDFKKYDYSEQNGKGIVAFVTPSDIWNEGAFIKYNPGSDGLYDTDDNTKVDAIYVHDPRFRGQDKVIRGLAHELGHFLGKALVTSIRGSKDNWWLLPDLYPNNKDREKNIEKHWDLMGNLLGQYDIERVHLSSYSKEWLGWLKYKDVDKGKSFAVESLVKMEYGDNALRYVYSPFWEFLAPNYFIFEVRTNSPTYSLWDTETLHQNVLAIYQVDERIDLPYLPRYDTVNLPGHLTTAPDQYDDPDAKVTIRLHSINEENAVVSVEDYKGSKLKGASLKTAAEVLSESMAEFPHEVTEAVALPDLDLHAFSEDGRHVGMNYMTGSYEIDIPGAMASGDLFNGREWIFVPENVDVYFVVSAIDNADFLDSLSEVQGLLSGIETYAINIVYYDSYENRYESSPVVQEIMPGEEVVHRFAIIENPDGTYTPVIDDTPPLLTVETPQENAALQDGVTLKAYAWDENGVSSVTFSIREPNGEHGTPISPVYEYMPAALSTDDMWLLSFDTTLLPDGYYLAYAEATDIAGNKAHDVVPFSIRNWACLELLPATQSNKAGRTMPVKFSLRILECVDSAKPFVWNEELTIKIYATDDPTNILQTSTYGTTARDYRIDTVGELYITNFKTLKTPKTYRVEIWRKDMLIGWFEFSTVK